MTTAEGTHLDCLLSSFGIKRLISESTCVLENSSCYYCLIFTNQTNILQSAMSPLDSLFKNQFEN